MVISAKTLAIQAVLTNVLFELKLLDPTLADAIARGFDNAANQIEDRAIQAAEAVSSKTLVKALSITEGLRTASIGGARSRAHRRRTVEAFPCALGAGKLPWLRPAPN